MAKFLQDEHFASQIGGSHPALVRAPNPAQFPEPQEQSASYWIKEYYIDLDKTYATAKLPEDVVDIVIIGSGITGASVAYHLLKTAPNLKVALVEARGICTGATGRNGGHICAPELYHVCDLADSMGAEETLLLSKLILRNRDMTLEAIKDLGAEEKVELRLKGTLTVFETQEERDSFHKDIEFAREHGFEPECRYVHGDEVSKIAKLPEEMMEFGGSFLDKSGTLYPRKLVDVLLKAALEKMPNFSIHPHTPVEKVIKEGDSSSYLVKTSKGEIRTRTVFHATNGYANHLIPSLLGEGGVFGCKSHMLGINPNVANSKAQLNVGFGYADFWHWMQQRPNLGPFLYGFDGAEAINDYDDTITIPTDHHVRDKMAKFLEMAFPEQFVNISDEKDVQYDWTGIQGLTMDGASIVGRPDVDSLGEFASVGHNGAGMTRCMASATVATDALLAYLNGNKDWTPPDWFPTSFRRNI